MLTPAVSQFLAGALLFYLIYQEKIRATAVILLLHGHDARLGALRTLKCIDENMTTYFTTFTLVNICLGVVTFAAAEATAVACEGIYLKDQYPAEGIIETAKARDATLLSWLLMRVEALPGFCSAARRPGSRPTPRFLCSFADDRATWLLRSATRK